MARKGVTDLEALLTDMCPSLSATPFAFATVASLQDVPASVRVLATFEEAEGFSVIAPFDEIDHAGMTHSGPWAKISLVVHSSLSAVGLTAAIASALAHEGISANIVAAYFHDHIFVTWESRHAAIRILNKLGGGEP